MNPGKGLGSVERWRRRLLDAGAFEAPGRVVGQADMNEEADQHESDQEELVQQRVGCHGGAPFSPW